MKETFKVQVSLVPLVGKQNILEMRVPQKLARLRGRLIKCQGWRVERIGE